MYIKVKNTARRFFDKSLDFRVRLFNILATGGVAISVATLVLNLVTGMLTGAVLSGLLAVLSVTLLVFTYRTRKYKIAYILTIVTIFMVVFPILFFASGAYKGGMPSMLIFAEIRLCRFSQEARQAHRRQIQGQPSLFNSHCIH